MPEEMKIMDFSNFKFTEPAPEFDNEYIAFESLERLQIIPDMIRFAVPQKTQGKIIEKFGDFSCLKELSKAGSFIFCHKDKDAFSDYLYTKDGIFYCNFKNEGNEENQDSAIIIFSVIPVNLRERNDAMKNGIVFKHQSSCIVDLWGQSESFVDGEVVARADYYDEFTDEATVFIRETLTKGITISETKTRSKKTDKLLELAENYARAAQTVGQQCADKAGILYYEKVGSAGADEQETERHLYNFFVSVEDFSKEKEAFYCKGTQVEVPLKNAERKSTAEIVDVALDDKYVIIKLLFNSQQDLDELEKNGKICPSINTVCYDVQMRAIERIKSGKAPAEYMNNLLGENISAGFDNIQGLKESLDKSSLRANDSQRKAIEDGICARDFYMVMGPPGTGKTTVIKEWVKYYVNNCRKRVLVSSQNNKAVDNVLRDLFEDGQMNILRIGSESKVDSSLVECLPFKKIVSLESSLKKGVDSFLSSIDGIFDENKLWLLDIIETYKRERDNISRSKTLLKNIHKSWAIYQKKVSGEDIILENDIEVDHWNLPKLYSALNKIVADKEKNIEKLKKAEKDFATRLEKNQAHADKNTLIRLFLDVLCWSTKGAVERAAQQYRQYLDLDVQYAVDYEKAYKKYFDTRRDFLCHVLAPYCCSWQEVHNLLKKVRGKMEETSHLTGSQHFGSIDSVQRLFVEGLQNKIVQDDVFTDSLCNKIYEEEERLKKTKSILEDWHEEILSYGNEELQKTMLENVDVVGATCIGVNSQRKFADIDFDVTIIDEAGQIQIHNALVPMSVSNKLIMLGDHMQIPPVANDEEVAFCDAENIDSHLLKCSLFEELYDKIPETNKTMLDTQYRMPAEIADTLSSWFYNNNYKSFEKKQNIKGALPWLSPKPYLVVDTSGEKNRFEQKPEDNMGALNNMEADIITQIVRRLQRDGRPAQGSVGIISAYKAQIENIRRKLAPHIGVDVARNISSTLDSYQGQQCPIVIYSFTKSNKRPADKSRIGFLNELRRLNVAMSRCQETLVLIGDMEFLSGCNYVEALDEQASEEEKKEVITHSEQMFSRFISHMLNDVKNGKGELITAREFYNRVEDAVTYE